ncbi:MAG: hypothetical protein HOP95_12430, partial [Sphingomonas sp.]|nr:hypothetical protein [Sphingomonas sp.]
MDSPRTGLGSHLVYCRLHLCADPCACAAVDPRARPPWSRSAFVGVHRHLVDGYRCLLRGTPVRQPQARPVDQSGQDRGRPLRRRRGGNLVRRRLGSRDGPRPCAAGACAGARRSRAGGRPFRKLDEAACRRVGLRKLAPGSWWSPRPSRRVGAGGCAYRRGPATGAHVTRKIAILGATGSVGKSTLDLVERNPDRFEVVAVTAASNTEQLAGIARSTGAILAVIAVVAR